MIERSLKFPAGQFVSIRGIGSCGFITGFDSETGRYSVEHPATMCGWIDGLYSEKQLIKSRKIPAWAMRRLAIREHRKNMRQGGAGYENIKR